MITELILAAGLAATLPSAGRWWSRVILTRGGKVETLEFGRDVIVSPASPAKTARTGIVFVGFGLRVPEVGHDDFRGVDVRGKVVLYVSGAPRNLTGALLAHSRNARERARVFEELGVAGTIAITVDSDVPWERTSAQRDCRRWCWSTIPAHRALRASRSA